MMGDYLERALTEGRLKWREIASKMPFFSVPDGYLISIIPPFGHADARFRVKRPDGEEISVYADFYDHLGCYGSPYWEVYPFEGDVGRCGIDDIEELWRMIK